MPTQTEINAEKANRLKGSKGAPVDLSGETDKSVSLAGVRIADWPDARLSDAQIKQSVLQRAVAVNLNGNATEQEVVAAENALTHPDAIGSDVRLSDLPENTLSLSDEKANALQRAKALHLKDDVTKGELKAAEQKAGISPNTRINDLSYTSPEQKKRANELLARAKAVKLDGTATEEDVKKAEANPKK